MKKQKASYTKILLAALSVILIYGFVTSLWTQKIETTISSSAIKSDQEYKVKQILFDLDGSEPILVSEQMIKSNHDGGLITSLVLPGLSIGQQYLVRTCVATSGYQYDDSLICEGQGVGSGDNLDQYLLNTCSEALPIKGQGLMSPSRLVVKKQSQSIDQCSGLFAGESKTSLVIENGQLIDKLSGESYDLKNLLLVREDQNASLVDNQDGTYSFRGSDGVEVVIDTTSNSGVVTELKLSGNTLSYTNQLGQTVGFDLTGLSTDKITHINVNSSNQLISYTNEAGTTTQIDIRSLETTTNLQVDIPGQSIRYINEEGAVVTADITSLETVSTLVDNNNGTYTYTNEDGASLTFENTLSTLSCTNGQSVAWNTATLGWECVSSVGLDVLTMISASGSTLSYLDELGNTTDIDVKDLESTSTLVDNNNGTYTYTDEDGTTTTITDTLATLLCTDNQVASWDNTNSVWVCADASALETLTYLSLSVDGHTLEYQDEDGSTTQINLATIIDNFESLTALSVNSLAGTLNYTDEDGTANTIDLKPLIAANETLTTLTVSGSTITYTDEDGGTTNIDIKDLETLTTVAQSGQGSFSYTDEAGTTHTIDTTDLINSSGDITITGSGTTADPYIVSFTETHTVFTGLNGTGKVIGTYTNENGDTFDLRETVTNLAINTTNQTITYTDEQGNTATADIKLLESTSTLVDNNNGTYTYTDEDGTTTTITDTLATLLCTDNQVASWDNTNSVWVCADASALETLTYLSLSVDGHTLEYQDEDGSTTQINLATIIDNFESLTALSVNSLAGTLNYTDEDGTANTIDLKPLIAANETLTTLTVSGSTITYTDEDGGTTNIDIKDLETLTTVAQSGQGSFSYTDEAGTTHTIDTTDLINSSGDITITGSGTTADPYIVSFTETHTVFTGLNGTGKVIGTYTNENGDTFDLRETVTNLAINTTNQTITYTDEQGNTATADIKLLESTSTLVDNNNGTYTYTDEDGTTTTITDTLATLLCTDNQVASWDNTNSVWVCADASALETLTYLSLSVDGHTLEYQDEDGSTTQINLATIIDNFESLTALSVNSLAGTLNYTDEDGTANTIDLKPLIAANETLTTLTVSGSTITYTDEDGGTTNIDIKDLETLTTVAQSGQGSFSYTDEAGTTHTIDTTDLINSSGDITITGSGTTADPYIVSFTETHTVFTGLNGTGKVIGTYTNENGDTFDLRETVTNLAINTTNQTITYTDEQGNTATADIKLLESTSTLVDNNNGTYTYTDEDGTTTTITDTLATLLCTDNQVASWDNTNSVWVCADASALETLTYLSLSVDGHTLEYQDEDGSTTQINLATIIDNFESLTALSVNSLAGTLNYTDEDGTANTIDLKPLIAANETLTTLTVSGSTITYTDEDGGTTNIDIKDLETLTTVAQSGQGSFSYTDEAGTTHTIDTTDLINSSGDITITGSGTTADPYIVSFTETHTVFTGLNGTGKVIGTYTNENGDTFDLRETVTNLAINTTNQTITYTDEQGNTATADIKLLESTSTLVDNNNGTYTYTDEDGTTTTITDTLATLLCTDNQVASWDNTNSVWVCADASALETLTYLSLSVDGHTLEYQDEDGSTTQINLATIIDNFESLTALSVNSLAGTLNYTDEDGTANTIDLKPLIAANETLTTLTVSGSTITYTDEDGGTTNIDIKDLETLTTVAQSGQGSFSYTDEAGTTHTIDTTDLINSSGDITITGSGTTADPYIVSFTETHTVFTGLNGTGKVIGTYTNENGDTFDLRETVTNLAINTTNQTITYTDEQGNTATADIKLLESTSTLVDNNNGTYTYTDEDGTTTTITDTLATLLCTDNQVASWDNTNSVWVCADASTAPSVSQVYLVSDLSPNIGGVPQDDPDDPAEAAMAYSDDGEIFFSWNVATQSWDIVEQISPTGLVCSIYDFISQPTWGSGEPSANRLFHDYLYNPTTQSYLLWSNDDQLYKEAPLPSYGTFNISAIDDPSAEFTNYSLVAGAMEPAWYYTQATTSFQQSRPSSTDTFDIGESFIWSASDLSHMVGVTSSTTNDIAYTNAAMDFVFYPYLAAWSSIYTPAAGTTANGNSGTLTLSGQTNTVMSRTDQNAFTAPTGSVWEIRRTGNLTYEIYEDGAKIVDVVTTTGGTKYITQGSGATVDYYAVEQNMEGYYGYGSDSHKEFLPSANTDTLEDALANGYFVSNHEADEKAGSTWDITDNYIQETGGSANYSTYLSQVYLDVGDKFVYTLEGDNDTYVGLGNTQVPNIAYTDVYNVYGSIRYNPATPSISFDSTVVLNPASQGGSGYIYEIERVADDTAVMRIYDKNNPSVVLVESQNVSSKEKLDRARIGFSTNVDNVKILPVEIPVTAKLQVDGTYLGDNDQVYTESEILSSSNVNCTLAGVGGGSNGDSDWLKTNDSTPTGISDDIYTLGNVGIGTNAPSVALEIDSNTVDQSGLKLTQLTRDSAVVDWYSQPIGVDIAGNVVRVQSEVLQVVDAVGATYIAPSNVISFDSVLSGTTWITGGWTSNQVVTIPAGMNATLDAEVVFGLTPAQTGTIRYAWREVGTSNYFGTEGVQTVTNKTKGARYVHLAETTSKQYELVIVDFGGALSVQSVQGSSEILVQEF